MKQTKNSNGTVTCEFDQCEIVTLRQKYLQYRYFASNQSYLYGFTNEAEKDCKLYEKLMEIMRQVCPKEVWQGL